VGIASGYGPAAAVGQGQERAVGDQPAPPAEQLPAALPLSHLLPAMVPVLQCVLGAAPVSQ
jgi:hypothetical protein